jgi:hypothetical protein
MTDRYVACRESDIPAGVRFDVPRRDQGQMIEVAYGGYGRAEHGEGDPYMRVTDHTDRSTAYYVSRDVLPTISRSELRTRALALAGTDTSWEVYRDGAVVRPAIDTQQLIPVVPVVQTGELIRWRGQAWRVVVEAQAQAQTQEVR